MRQFAIVSPQDLNEQGTKRTQLRQNEKTVFLSDLGHIETYCPNETEPEAAEELEKLGAEAVYCNKVCFSECNPEFNSNEER